MFTIQFPRKGVLYLLATPVSSSSGKTSSYFPEYAFALVLILALIYFVYTFTRPRTRNRSMGKDHRLFMDILSAFPATGKLLSQNWAVLEFDHIRMGILLNERPSDTKDGRAFEKNVFVTLPVPYPEERDKWDVQDFVLGERLSALKKEGVISSYDIADRSKEQMALGPEEQVIGTSLDITIPWEGFSKESLMKVTDSILDVLHTMGSDNRERYTIKGTESSTMYTHMQGNVVQEVISHSPGKSFCILGQMPFMPIVLHQYESDYTREGFEELRRDAVPQPCSLKMKDLLGKLKSLARMAKKRFTLEVCIGKDRLNIFFVHGLTGQRTVLNLHCSDGSYWLWANGNVLTLPPTSFSGEGNLCTTAWHILMSLALCKSE